MDRSPFVHVAASRAPSTAQALAEIEGAGSLEAASLVCFFASPKHDLTQVAAAVRALAPGAVTAGCSTMGELGPAGVTRGGISVIAIGAPMRSAGVMIDDLSALHPHDAEGIVHDLADELGFDPDGLVPSRHCFVALTDGLSGLEPTLLRGLALGAPGIPLVGGSAGDDFEFKATWTALDGRACPGSAVVLLLEPGVPFMPFHTHHFQATATRVVVTRASPERRLVHEIDGRPAVEALSSLINVPEAALRASKTGPPHHHSFGLKLAGRYFMRSVMTIQGNDLLMGTAVEPGTVLRLMRGGDLVVETATGVKQAVEALGERPAGMLLFNCGGRHLEAESSRIVAELGRAMCPYPAAGFTTYGEHYGPLQVNQTLTGLLFGSPG